MSRIPDEQFHKILKSERFKYRALGMLILPFLVLWIIAENRRFIPRTMVVVTLFVLLTWAVIYSLGRSELDSLLGICAGYLFCGAVVGDIKFKADYAPQLNKKY